MEGIERTYTHKSGIEFDLGLIDGHDITVIMLYACADEDEPFDEGFWLVDYVWGNHDDSDDRDCEYLTDQWLAKQPEGFVDKILRRQAKYNK